MENESQLPADTPQTAQPGSNNQDLRAQRQTIYIAIIFIVLFLIITVGGVILLLQPSTDTARIRDIFIIFMALESLFLGLTIVILIIQLARLINLLQNEIVPILDSTNETVSTLRGTTTFLSDNLVEPVIKVNEQFAGLRQLMILIGLARGPRKKTKNQGE